MPFLSTKTYTHAEGLSCCFRQWRADSHCKFLHGYAIQVTLTFAANSLDERNWVVDFGGLKDIKKWLHDTFDHKTLIAKDDPELETLQKLHTKGIIDLVLLPQVSCEMFAKHIFDHVRLQVEDNRVRLQQVEVREHGGNAAVYQRPQDPTPLPVTMMSF